MNGEQHAAKPSFWRTRGGIVTCISLGIAGILLIFEHRGHSGHGQGSSEARPRNPTHE